MARSVLASTISILSSVVLKNGQPAAISRSRPLSSKEERARPTPYQPGSMIRACAQLNTQGMARRSSMRVDFVREAGRLPIFRPEISRMGVACRKNRSEEHTSELQSLMRISYAVFCLKKKKKKKQQV